MFNSNAGYSLADIAAVTDGNRNDGYGWGGNGCWWIILLFLFGLGGWGRGFGGWGSGFGDGFGINSAAGQGALTRADLCSEFNFNNLDNAVRGIQYGLCDGFYTMNTSLLNGFNGVDNAICQLGYQTQQGFNSTNVALMQGQNALATQLANCCCDTKSAIQQANFDNTVGQNAISRQIADCCCETGRQIERGFADVNYNMATNTCAIQTSLANSTRDIIDSQNAGTRAILDYLCQEKISDLQNENQALRLAASQQAQNAFITANQEAQTAEIIRRLGRDCPVPAYVVPNPNCCYGNYGYNYNNCGCSC